MAVNRQRQKIWTEAGSLSLDGLTLKQALNHIKQEIRHHGVDAQIRKVYDTYDGGSCWWQIRTQRDETDKEMNGRIKDEEYRENLREQQDANEYRRLQAKFGNGTSTL